MSKKNNYQNKFNDDWSNGPRERKDKPGKKHNNTNHKEQFNEVKKPAYKPPQKFKRHSDNDDDD